MSPANDLNPAFRPRWTGVLTLYLLAITIGAASAWLAVRSQLDSGGVSAGVWRTSTLAGSTDADLYTRAVDLLVSRLRKKLEPLDAIKTLRNAGYALALRRAA